MGRQVVVSEIVHTHDSVVGEVHPKAMEQQAQEEERLSQLVNPIYYGSWNGSDLLETLVVFELEDWMWKKTRCYYCC